MRTTTFLSALSATITLITAQVTLNDDDTNTFTCAQPNKAYCAGDGFLSTTIIIRCTSGALGIPGNCNDNLAFFDPLGVKSFAPCYQSSPTAGDAVCSFNCIAHPDFETSFPVPGCTNGSSTSTSTSTTTTAPSTTVTITPSYLSSGSLIVFTDPILPPRDGSLTSTLTDPYPAPPGGDPTAPPFPISSGSGGSVGTTPTPTGTVGGTGTAILPSVSSAPFVGAAAARYGADTLAAMGAMAVIAAHL